MVGLCPYAIVEKSQENNKKGGELEDIFSRIYSLKVILLVTWVMTVTKFCARYCAWF